MADHRFQIHLGGVIDLLSNHLYSSPDVYVRELLQNATDAIRARGGSGQVRIEVFAADDGGRHVTFSDDGIGLDEDDVHAFLATIGASSKRGELEGGGSFIGRFGIGLLSCFVVSERIDVVTRKEGCPAVRWSGRADGTYSIELDETGASETGTTVHLTSKAGRERWFEEENVRELASRYGELLPFPVIVAGSSGEVCVSEAPPWRRDYETATEAKVAREAFGARVLDHPGGFLDVIDLNLDDGGIEGVALVLPHSPSLNAPPAHRVYLKDMLIAERAENLLPRWAFFVTCVINAQTLRPTASRESFYEDETLERARESLGRALRSWLVDLRAHDPAGLDRLIGVHYRSIKALAAHDDEMLELFLDLLPFETSLGSMRFREIRKRFRSIRYAPSVDVFRQIAHVAAAQGIGVINAGYSFDPDLIRRAGEVFDDLEVVLVDATDVTAQLADVDDETEARFEQLMDVADRVLGPVGCRAALKRFRPEEVPALYVIDREAGFQRALDAARELQGSDSAWSGVLDSLDEGPAAKATLVFNAKSPLAERLTRVEDPELLRLHVQTLYVQSLLLGHHPLSPDELAMLNDGLLGLIEHSLDQAAFKVM